MTEIGGTQGNSDGSKVIEAIVHTVIEPTFLPAISWTGRGRGKEKKISLSKYTNVTKLIAEVMNKADRSFDLSKTLSCLKYKIIKHAPTKYGSNRKDDSKVMSDQGLTVTQTVARYILSIQLQLKCVHSCNLLILCFL